MSADKQEGALKPVTPARVAEELKKLSAQRKDGKLEPDEYEHRFARMIGELRDRRIDGSRAEILSTLTPLKDQGIISATDWQRLTKQLGLG
jgi:chorismate mutase